MAKKKNIINFGLTRLAWAPITRVNGLDTYGTVRVLEGARSLTASKLGELFTEWADGRRYYTDRTNNGYNLVTELVHADAEFRRYILGETLDENGVQIENENSTVAHFALLAEFLGNEFKGRRVFYDCFADRPDITGTTAKDNDQLSSHRDSINIVCSPRINDGAVTAYVTPDVSDVVYDNWFNSVYQPASNGFQSITVTVSLDGTPVEGALVSDSEGNQALTNNSGVAYLYELPGTYKVFASYDNEGSLVSGSADVTLSSGGAAATITLS